jgi:hypothetical protein
VVDASPYATRLNADGARRRVHTNALHAREVDHQAIVAGPEAGAIVAAPANSCEHLVIAPELHRCHYVGNVDAARDQLRPFVDHSVVHLAR